MTDVAFNPLEKDASWVGVYQLLLTCHCCLETHAITFSAGTYCVVFRMRRSYEMHKDHLERLLWLEFGLERAQ